MGRISVKAVATIAIAGLLTVVAPMQLIAQVTPAQPSGADDQQLRNFAKVYVQVEKIRETYEPRAKAASGPDEGKQIQQEAQSKFKEALTKEGLSEESFTQIFDMARADEGVRKKVLQMIAEERSKS
jgi:Domain of unknown function (DUF4168)